MLAVAVNKFRNLVCPNLLQSQLGGLRTWSGREALENHQRLYWLLCAQGIYSRLSVRHFTAYTIRFSNHAPPC